MGFSHSQKYVPFFFFQPFETESNSKSVEVGLIVICAAVHFFAPYNMAEGRSRYRYTVAYSIEAIEIVVGFACEDPMSNQQQI